ncbi:MAG: bacteriohemerythrin [candidate division Zixibacteria bacterium]|nr:bacteriohemerythrin [candidate division Zixibacteria bacterium]
MPLIVWDSTYSVYLEEMDRQHRRLIAIINRLDQAVRQGRGKDEVGQVLNELAAYTRYHFTDEETLMTQHDHPKLENHIEEHRVFVQKIQDCHTQYLYGDPRVATEVLDFLANWLVDHIQGSDKEYGARIAGKMAVQP